MATHSSILAWRLPWAEEPGGLQSIRLQSQSDNLANKQQQRQQRAISVAQPGIKPAPCAMKSRSLNWTTGEVLELDFYRVHPRTGISYTHTYTHTYAAI